MRITWQSCDWLAEQQRLEVEARLEKLAAEDGSADRVEISSKELDQSEWIEVRVSGTASKCQLTAVREHADPSQALSDALEAFERSVGYVAGFSPGEMKQARRGSVRPARAHAVEPPTPRRRRRRRRSSRAQSGSSSRRSRWVSGLAVVLVGAGLWALRSGDLSWALPWSSPESDVAYSAVAGGVAAGEAPAYRAIAEPGPNSLARR